MDRAQRKQHTCDGVDSWHRSVFEERNATDDPTAARRCALESCTSRAFGWNNNSSQSGVRVGACTVSTQFDSAGLSVSAPATSSDQPDEADEGETQAEEASAKKIKLRTLAPDFKADHHSLYVRHLEEAILEKRNRNIALTGRYGAGKSSVLDEFERTHKSTTVRISINTLGPDEDDEDLTNRIQKELVKQLVYRLKPGQVRRSRFARPKPITKWRALWQALAVSSVGLSLLWLVGIRPSEGWPGADASVLAQLGLGTLFFALVVLVVWSVRWLIGDRLVSEVSTGGTKIALSDGPTTYFDSFLDEIVAFFDAVEPKFVIFEDLDRFDDPQIFDSLRELNTLVNASAHWASKDQPLRFVYAIKDSLFEQLGSTAPSTDDEEVDRDSEASGDRPVVSRSRESTFVTRKPDLATEAVRRANRTKFFEMVIPIVPFLSHRNARDHLSDALTALGFPEDFVSRPLLDLVARHTTDMRLMINICNEFAVFVERLLWTKTSAPGMTADHLFALVVYKNFHMADFENIAQRTSTLDTLEQHHRDEVRALVEVVQTQRRTRTQLEVHRERRERTASSLGKRLQDMKSAFPNPYGSYPITFVVGGTSFAYGSVEDVGFWEEVAANPAISVSQTNAGSISISAEQMLRLFPELESTAHWIAPNAEALARLTKQFDEDIATLRGAGFVELAAYSRVPQGRKKFEQHISDDLESELARDLVRRGFITRNFAEYSAIFFGKFVGVDVAYFYNHSVQPNEMYLDFQFTTPNAVNNLLEQVPSDFVSSISALNLDVVDHLLSHRHDKAKEVAAYVASHDTSPDVRGFMGAFLNTSGAQHEAFVALLAEHPWGRVFEFLAGDQALPDEESRLRAFSAALLNAGAADRYVFGDAAVGLLQAHHSQMPAIAEEQTTARVTRVFEILQSVGLVIPDLSMLSKPLRDRVVDVGMYEISVPNLKLALGVEHSPTLDELRKSAHVWEYCLSRIDNYLRVMSADDSVQFVVASPQVLVDVINEQDEVWPDDQIQAVIAGGADELVITSLKDVPERFWPDLAASRHMMPSALNVAEFVKVHGFDAHLANLLAPEGDRPLDILGVDELDGDECADLAVAMLNAATVLNAEKRVALARQVVPDDGVNLSAVNPSPDQLLARGLEAGLFDDDLRTFTHFAAGGWAATSEAFAVSQNAVAFMSPAIVRGYVAEFLTSANISPVMKRTVLGSLSQYVPTDEAIVLRAAGEVARSESFKLPIDQVKRIAGVSGTTNAVMRQLVLSAKDLPSHDVVEILALLGAPYSNLATGPGATFDFPSNVSSIETVFRRLEADGRVKISKKLLGSGRVVKVLD